MSELAKFQRLLLVFSLGLSAVFLLRYSQMLFSGNATFAEDFLVYWRALDAVSAWPPLSPYHAYDDAQYFKGLSTQYHPFLNPPFFLLLLAPLALFPYPAAVAVWYALQMLFLLWVLDRPYVRALWPRWASPTRASYLSRTVILVLPFIINTVFSGQIGILLAALFIWGLGLLKERPFAAGAAFVLLSVKPQMLPVVGVLLLFGRHGSALLTYLIGVAALVIACTAVWGMPIWEDYNAALALHTDMISLPAIPAAYQTQLISVYGGLKLIGVETAPAFVIQAVVAVVALAVLAYYAYKHPFSGATFALALASVGLSSFYVLQYDVVMLAAAMLLLMESSTAKGLTAGTRLSLILVLSSGIVVPMLQAGGLPLGALTILVFWWQCLSQNKPTA